MTTRNNGGDDKDQQVPAVGARSTKQERDEAAKNFGTASHSTALGNAVREIDQLAQKAAAGGTGADHNVSAAFVTELAGIRDRMNEALQQQNPGEEPKVKQL